MPEYTPTVWVNKETKLGPTNLNKIEAGIAAALPRDGVKAAGETVFQTKLLAADAEPTFRVKGDGDLEWGAGGASAPDVNLYRSGVDTLRTDDTFVVVGELRANGIRPDNSGSAGLWTSAGTLLLLAGSGIQFGSSSDVNLYRSADNRLKTDDSFSVGGNIDVNVGGWIDLLEIADPAAPASNHGVLYVRDNGSGKTQLCARFPTGAVQVIATEP